jgi:DNA (cytosine-5)-methyltransferase 1
MKNKTNNQCGLAPLPVDQNEAVAWLLVLVRASGSNSLIEVPADVFKRGWFAVGFLYPGLHPDSALHHGDAISNEAEYLPDIARAEPRLLAPFYVESGWPLVLAPIAAEAWRRFDSGELRDDEIYCSEAVIAGMCSRAPSLAESIRTDHGHTNARRNSVKQN